MIAADTSTWIAFLEGESGDDVQMLDQALRDRQVVMAPAVLTELLSDPEIPRSAAGALAAVPLLDVETGYWERAGRLRARVVGKKRKARLGDALIAQTCLDHAVSLLTRDRDFRAFADAAGLKLVIG